MASPIPVLPLVASTTVWPGLRRPRRSASSMTPRARRSLTEASGLIRTTGVLPTVSRMLAYLPGMVPPSAAQFVALDLAGRGLRQGRGELDPAGVFPHA